MLSPRPEALLRVWEEQQAAHPVRRALALLAACTPAHGWAAWAQAPIGARDGALMALHETLFGAALHTTASCDDCGERLESSFGVHDVCAPRVAEPGAWPALSLRQGDVEIDYRLPCSEDLLLADGDDAEAACTQILRRCVLHARQAGGELPPQALSPALADAVAAAMAAEDPRADIRIGLACPACGATHERTFDIVAYLWSELDDWAQRLLADVHRLASAYGWTEADVLALSPTRRRLYLDMVAP